MTLSDGLRRFRKEFKLTQKQISSSIDVAESLYHRYEYGKVVPSATVLIDISNNFNVSIDYLVGRTDNPEINR